jgi:hypothetical protein
VGLSEGCKTQGIGGFGSFFSVEFLVASTGCERQQGPFPDLSTETRCITCHGRCSPSIRSFGGRDGVPVGRSPGQNSRPACILLKSLDQGMGRVTGPGSSTTCPFQTVLRAGRARSGSVCRLQKAKHDVYHTGQLLYRRRHAGLITRQPHTPARHQAHTPPSPT